MFAANLEQLPEFLRTYEELNSYIRDTLDEMDNTSKGRSFARFVSKVIPISGLGERFTEVEVGQDSNDGGVDLTSYSADDTAVLYGQSKLTIKGIDELDSILSKFKDYQETIHALRSMQLFDISQIPVKKENNQVKKNQRKAAAVAPSTSASAPQEVHFVIVTLSKIKNRILPLYEKSRLASKDYYKDCYEKFGDSLFLENIRLFLGYPSGKYDRDNVNDSIKETAEHYPRLMLARNNGITFRAKKVEIIDNSSLRLEQASIVNGCQTTMCIVQSSSTDACVLVKIVEVSDSWDIAKSANFQNKVDQIALEVARYMRPQALQQAASKAGILVEDKNESLYDIFNSIYQDRVRYDEAFHLFLGLFSKHPRNVIGKNYTELRTDFLEQYQTIDPQGEGLFELLFMLYKAAEKGGDIAVELYQGEAYKNIFQRFWKDKKPDYRSVITILAACGCVRKNIYKADFQINDMEEFIEELKTVLLNDEEKFIRYYCYAYEGLMTYLRFKNEGKTDKDIQRTMYEDLKAADFNSLYDHICMMADGREPR